MDEKTLSQDASLYGPLESNPWDVPHREEALFAGRTPKTMHWSIPWSDLMMTMFILFVILYIYQAPNGEVLPQNGRVSVVGTSMTPGSDMAIGERGAFQGTFKESISGIFDLSRETVRANDLEDFASVDLVPNKAVRIVLAGDLLFDTGKADLRPGAKHSLRRIGNILRQTPYVVNVVGHTDDVPIHSETFPSNWELSTIRACQVARFLIEETGLPGRRFYVSGHAYHEPVFANNSAGNRSANRRVEIIITKEKPNAQPGIGENNGRLVVMEKSRRAASQTWPWSTFQ
jgi:chemotaxis protein MotB